MCDDTCHPSIDAGVRVATATAGIREVAVATATEETLVSLTTAVAARLTAEPDALSIAPVLMNSRRDALRLLPLAQSVVIDAAIDVLMARKLPTTIRSPRPIIIPSN